MRHEKDILGISYISLFTEPVLKYDEESNLIVSFAPGMGRTFFNDDIVPTKTWHYHYPQFFTILEVDTDVTGLAVIEDYALLTTYNLERADVSRYLEFPCYLESGGLYPGLHSPEAMLEFCEKWRQNPDKIKVEDPVNWSEYAMFGGHLELLAKTYLGSGLGMYGHYMDWEIGVKEVGRL